MAPCRAKSLSDFAVCCACVAGAMPVTRQRPTHPISLQTVRDAICPPFSVTIPFSSRRAPDTLSHQPLWRECAIVHACRQGQTRNACKQQRLINSVKRRGLCEDWSGQYQERDDL